jgi:hypothetical protein
MYPVSKVRKRYNTVPAFSQICVCYTRYQFEAEAIRQAESRYRYRSGSVMMLLRLRNTDKKNGQFLSIRFGYQENYAASLTPKWSKKSAIQQRNNKCNIEG